MRHIRIWVYDGILASGAAAVIDVLTTANMLWANAHGGRRAARLFDWHVESPTGRPVRTASGQELAVDGAITARGAADAVVVTAPFVADMPQFLARMGNLQPMLAALRHQHARGALLASYCSGSFLLAEAGLLDDSVATTHWALVKTFRKRYPRVDLRSAEVMTEQDRIICTGAVTSYFNLALRLVEIFAGAAVATLAGRLLLIDTSRVSQAAYATLTLQDRQPHADPLVARAQRWMEKHLHEPFRMAALARHVAASERTVSRRFQQTLGQAPLQHLQGLRIEVAKRLLEGGGITVDAVGERVGYQDLSTFRRVFKRGTGLSPRAYQHRFSRRLSVSARKSA